MKSSWKVKDGTAGDWTLTPGKWFGDAKADAGIQTGPDARFFAIGAPFKKPVDTDGKTLVLQVRTRKPRARWTEPLADQPLVVATDREQSPPRRLRCVARAPGTDAQHAHAVLRQARAEAGLRRWLHQAAAQELVRARTQRPPVRDACGCLTSLTRVCPTLVFVQQAGGLWR